MTNIFPRTRKLMKRVVEENQTGVFKRVLQVNTDSIDNIGFDTPGGNAPTGVGVHRLEGSSKVMIYPYGKNAGDGPDDFRMGVQYWYPIYDNASTRTHSNIGWIPVTAGLFDCTINGSIRGASGPLTTADEFCDNNKEVTGTTSAFIHKDWDDFVGTGGDIPTLGSSTIILNTSGASYIQFHFDRDGADGADSAANCNALFMEI
jgi:hypothetical protein